MLAYVCHKRLQVWRCDGLLLLFDLHFDTRPLRTQRVCIEDITEALWGSRVSPSTISDLHQKIFERVEERRNWPLEPKSSYIFVDGIWLKCSWGGEVQNVSVLVAIGVSTSGFRKILGVAEGSREDAESWRQFLRYLRGRGLEQVDLVVSDKSLGFLEALGEFYPDAK